MKKITEADKYDEKALLLGLMLGNETLNDGHDHQDIMAQALRESAAEAWDEASKIMKTHNVTRLRQSMRFSEKAKSLRGKP